jgi:hypothetical protein
LAPTIPEIEPTSFVVGDTLKWYRTFSDYPASEGWVLTYSFRGADALDLNATHITNDGTRYVIVVPAATTALLQPGVFTWTAYATLAGERYTAATGTAVVQADLATAEPRESDAVRQLAIVEAAIEGRLTADTESFQINGKSVNKTPIETLYKIRDKLRWEVYGERNGSLSMPVKVTFRGV